MIIMKKHILSDILVSSELGNRIHNSKNINSVISETATIEDSTPDELYAMGKSEFETRSVENSSFEEYELGTTKLTKSLESSDADEFVMCGTKVTGSIKNLDLDGVFLMDYTKQTFTIENTDADEFGNICTIECWNEDYDDILFI